MVNFNFRRKHGLSEMGFQKGLHVFIIPNVNNKDISKFFPNQRFTCFKIKIYLKNVVILRVLHMFILFKVVILLHVIPIAFNVTHKTYLILFVLHIISILYDFDGFDIYDFHFNCCNVNKATEIYSL